MIFVSDADVDRYIGEDVPYLDLTSLVLGLEHCSGCIEYFTRVPGVLCGTEEAIRVMTRLGLEVVESSPSGTLLTEGDTFLIARGSAEALHAAWKVCLNIFDRCSAIATATRHLVDSVHAIDPKVAVLTTRKTMPGTKSLVTHAIISGGAYPHRLGLSETILVFAQHIEFLGGIDAFVELVPRIKSHACEKKIIVETQHDAIRLAEAGVDGIQFDKLDTDTLRQVVADVRAIDPHITLLAAGGVNAGNAAEYASTGIDAIVTTSLFDAKPLDMSARMRKE